ncbi:putative purine permease 11 [Vitis vinifera]|uniref:Probable purine permease n=1 Tax=Vitis vinifera TaxID=29760 RepID=A0A438IZU8_VITVI|nr:putative purine permease 11 [Vitis vinifera]
MGLEEEGCDLRGGESLRCQSLKDNGVESEARGVERVVVLLYEKLTNWGISNDGCGISLDCEPAMKRLISRDKEGQFPRSLNLCPAVPVSTKASFEWVGRWKTLWANKLRATSFELARELNTLGFCLAITTPLNLSNLEPMYPRWLSVGRKIRKKIDPKKGVSADPILSKDETLTRQSSFIGLKCWQWWLLVALNIFFLLAGQAAAVLLGRFYYDKGGNSKWMATFVQTAAFPILLIPLFLIPSSKEPSTTTPPSWTILASIYIALGVVLAGDNMLYSTGLLYLTASTYSLICATQLAFNAVFSSTSILKSISKGKYAIGIICTLAASALYSLLLSLMQLSFEKVIKKETFSVVLEMQIYTSIVATCASLVGLFASGEWKTLHGEMNGFGKGRISYVMTLVWTAVAWQVCSVGVVGLIFLVSSLFSNVISTVSLAVVPIASVMVFHDEMNGVKVIAMLLAFWGFASYIYQNYLDDRKAIKAQTGADDNHPDDSSCC